MYYVAVCSDELFRCPDILGELVKAAPAQLTGSTVGDENFPESFWDKLKCVTEAFYPGLHLSGLCQHGSLASMAVGVEEIGIFRDAYVTCYSHFWVIHSRSKALYDTAGLKSTFLGGSKTMETIDGLFRGLADAYKWSIIPWANGDGQFCAMLITRSEDLIDACCARAAIPRPSHTFAGFPLPSDSLPMRNPIVRRYSVASSFRSVCTGMLISPRINETIREELWRELGGGAGSMAALIPCESTELWDDDATDYFSPADLEQVAGPWTAYWHDDITYGHHVVRDIRTFWALVSMAAIRKPFDARFFPVETNPDILRLLFLLDDKYEPKCAYDLLATEQVRWMLSAGRSNGDLSDILFASEVRSQMDAMLSIIKADNSDESCMISCF